MKGFFKINFFLKIGILTLNILFAGPYRKFSGEEYSRDKNNIINKEVINNKNISYNFFLKKVSDLDPKNLEKEELNFIKKSSGKNDFLIYLNKKEINLFLIENKGEDFYVGYFLPDKNEIILNTLYLKILGVTDEQKEKILTSVFKYVEIFKGVSLD